MASLQEHVQTALNENRILVLGTQVLLGFQLRATFESKFDHLPFSSRVLMLVALTLLMMGLGLLLLPTAYHRLADSGEDSPRFLSLIGREMRLTLPLLTGVMSIQLFVASTFVVPTSHALALSGVLCVGAWVYLGVLERHGQQRRSSHLPQPSRTTVEKKVDHVLTETRVVLPGAQALLGFQFITVFMDGFDRLPGSSKMIHLISLCLIALTVLLLLAPAARHRIVEKGEDTPEFERHAGHMLIAALVPLGLGCAGDLYVVTQKVTGSTKLGILVAVLMSLFFFGLWFGVTLWRRTHDGWPVGRPMVPRY